MLQLLGRQRCAFHEKCTTPVKWRLATHHAGEITEQGGRGAWDNHASLCEWVERGDVLGARLLGVNDCPRSTAGMQSAGCVKMGSQQLAVGRIRRRELQAERISFLRRLRKVTPMV